MRDLADDVASDLDHRGGRAHLVGFSSAAVATCGQVAILTGDGSGIGRVPDIEELKGSNSRAASVLKEITMKKRNKAIIGSAAVVAALVTAVGAAGVARGNVNLNDQLVGSEP